MDFRPGRNVDNRIEEKDMATWKCKECGFTKDGRCKPKKCPECEKVVEFEKAEG